tara:strand:+ start:1310 stop:1840 length:531 start_codon:yes stop_codon:yes gene_type:complete
MKIYKHIERKILRDFTFIKGNIDLDQNYFIDQIEKGITEKDNQNFQTSVVGKMTDWKYFVKDKFFVKLITEIFLKLENKTNFQSFAINEAWGFKEGFGEKTKKHNHLSSYLSGVIYFSKFEQSLIFDEIGEEVEVDIGNFAIFDGWLQHQSKRGTDSNIKYGIAFNSTRDHGIFTN